MKLELELTECERRLLRGLMHFALVEIERTPTGTKRRELLAKQGKKLVVKVWNALEPSTANSHV